MTEDPFRFAAKTLDLLRFGGFTATYKYAVLLGLLDLCVEFNDQGGTPTTLTTTQLAAKIVDLYWPQTWDYGTRGVLRQSSGRQARIVTLIADWRARHAPAGASLSRVRAERPAAFAKLVRQVEWKLVQMPLPKLQRIGGHQDRFIYTIAWSDDVKKGEFEGPDFDNRLHLVPGAAAHLVRAAPLLRPLIHREWAVMVARLNELPMRDLEAFLFVADTQLDLGPIRDPILELQGSRCFYCKAKIREHPEVDHFIPRARHLDHGIDNLVVAHDVCNGSKSDFLVHTDHLRDWADRFARQGDALAAIAAQTKWGRDRARTRNIVRTIYAQLGPGMALWQRRGRKTSWESGDPARIQATLAALR